MSVCLSVVNVVFCQVEVSARAYHSYRAVLPNAYVRLSVIVKPPLLGGPGPLGDTEPWGWGGRRGDGEKLPHINV